MFHIFIYADRFSEKSDLINLGEFRLIDLTICRLLHFELLKYLFVNFHTAIERMTNPNHTDRKVAFLFLFFHSPVKFLSFFSQFIQFIDDFLLCQVGKLSDISFFEFHDLGEKVIHPLTTFNSIVPR